MKFIAILVAIPLMTACEVHSPADGDENVSISTDENGQVAFNVPFASGQVKLPASAMQDGEFDIDGVQMFPGSRMTGFNLDSSGNGAIVKMTFAAPASPDKVRAYFQDEFTKKGVGVAASADGLSGKSKDGDDFVINVEPAPQGSNGTITIHSKH